MNEETLKLFEECGWWVNIYPKGDTAHMVGTVYDTQDDANKEAGKSRVACIYISWKEKL